LGPVGAVHHAPVDARQEEHVRPHLVAGVDHTLARGVPGIAGTPVGSLAEADESLVARRRPHVVEVVPDLQVTAGEPLEVSEEENLCLRCVRYLTASTKKLSRSRLSSSTISGKRLFVSR